MTNITKPMLSVKPKTSQAFISYVTNKANDVLHKVFFKIVNYFNIVWHVGISREKGTETTPTCAALSHVFWSCGFLSTIVLLCLRYIQNISLHMCF